MIRQPFPGTSVYGCKALSRKLDSLLANKDVAEWELFVKTSFMDDGLYAAVLHVLKQPNSGDRWMWASRVVEQFKEASVIFYHHGLPEQLRLGEDVALLKVLRNNLNLVTSRLEEVEDGEDVKYEEFFAIATFARALAILADSSSYNLPSRLAVSKLGATKCALRALIALQAITPDRIVRNGKGEDKTNPSVNVALLHTHFSLLRLIYNMTLVPSEQSKFVGCPDGALAVVSSLSAAWPLTSSRCSDVKDMALRAIGVGLPVLADMARDDSLATLFLRTKQAGRDALAFTSSVVAEAQWHNHGAISRAPSAIAADFLYTVSPFADPLDLESTQFAVGRKCARDESVMKGLLEAVTLIGSGNNESRISVAIDCFGELAHSVAADPLGADAAFVASMWLKAGVFSAISPAVLKLDESRPETVFSLEGVFKVAFFACGLIRRPEGDLIAPWEALMKSGILRVVNKRVAEKCSNQHIITFLKWALSKGCIDGGPRQSVLEVFEAMHLQTPKALRSDRSAESSTNGSASDLRKGVLHSSDPSGKSNGSGREAAVLDPLDAPLDESSRRLWPCSNPGCSSIESRTVRIKKCACGMSRYCSVACQRVDWIVHKRTCTARN